MHAACTHGLGWDVQPMLQHVIFCVMRACLKVAKIVIPIKPELSLLLLLTTHRTHACMHTVIRHVRCRLTLPGLDVRRAAYAPSGCKKLVRGTAERMIWAIPAALPPAVAVRALLTTLLWETLSETRHVCMLLPPTKRARHYRRAHQQPARDPIRLLSGPELEPDI